MDICLITSPSDPDLGGEYNPESRRPLQTPLGLLCLGASAAAHGHSISILNLDTLACSVCGRTEAPISPRRYFEAASDAIARTAAELYGFSSICCSYPMTLRLAQNTKRLHPQAFVVLGGPQATAVDTATLEAVPAIDAIVRGEADLTFPTLLDRIERSGPRSTCRDLRGITYRSGEAVVRNPDASQIMNLDDLPIPAFELDPEISHQDWVSLEAGRGCPFSCTFCSTNIFFGRRARFKSPAVLVRLMNELSARFGFKRFSLIHDMFTVNRDYVIEFTRLLMDSGNRYDWSCSARTDTVDDALLAQMAEAGCTGIFFGIEAGSTMIQRSICKNLDLTQARRVVISTTEQGMKATAAFITGFPDERRNDIRETIHLYVELTRITRASPQLSLLAPLAGSSIWRKYREQLVFDHIYSDLSVRSWREDDEDLELIKSFPDVFPQFYSPPTVVPRSYVAELIRFINGACFWFRWLPVALLYATGDLLGVFDKWMSWNAENHQNCALRSLCYYRERCFAMDFLRFVHEGFTAHFLAESDYLVNVLRYEELIGSLIRSPVLTTARSARLSYEDRVGLADGVVLHRLPFDLVRLLSALKKDPVDYVADENATWVAAVQGTAKRSETRVFQLADAALALIRECDGLKTVNDIVDILIPCALSKKQSILRHSAFACLRELYQCGILQSNPSTVSGPSNTRMPFHDELGPKREFVPSLMVARTTCH